MFHLSAFYEQIDAAGALANLAAVQDQILKTSGDDIYAPSDLPNIIGEAATIETTADVQAQVMTPSLRLYGGLNISPYSVGLTFPDGNAVNMHPYNPVPIVGNESVNLLHENNPAGVTDQYGLVWFGDGPQNPVQGYMFTVRCTMSVTGVLGSWVNGNLTFPQDLPVGTYDVVGMRCEEANGIAARLLFPNQSWRPGVQCVQDTQDQDNWFHRFGRMGVWGTFETNTEPTVDILTTAGAKTPSVYLDLVAR